MSDVGTCIAASPRSGYVHVPFCRHRCGYCNFSVLQGRDDLAETFVDVILQELGHWNAPELDTVFFGGGTPTHLSDSELSRLLSGFCERASLSADAEVSVEANPEDITSDRLKLLLDHGVNRISMGVQSFDEDKLARLERGHDRDRAIKAIELASQIIGNVSIDLIFAAPGETLSIWKSDLATAFSLPINHLSTYALTFEQGTSFWTRRVRGEIMSAEEDLELSMYEWVLDCAPESGFEHYEVSSFAKSGFRCRHNLAYWHGAGWFAAGPSAAGFVDGVRTVNHRSPTTYLERMKAGISPIVERDSIDRETHARERLAFGLRMIDGVDLEGLSGECGIRLGELCGSAISQCEGQGWLLRDGDRLRMSRQGILFADSIASLVLSD
ncbi:MAG: radical SAM family heme chaperone HemW [Planctomycetota bacterium]